MHIQVLGGYGAEFYSIKNKCEKRYRPTGFLLNQSVVFEAGTICGALTLSELTAIRSVFLSHAHLDHLQGLAYLAETLYDRIDQPITVFGLEETIQTLRHHFFNNRLWPDFTRLPTEVAPVLRYQTMEEGIPVTAGDIHLIPIPVNHTVPTAGFIIDDGQAAIAFSGDTHKTEALWERVSQIPYLKAAFIECSFPDRFSQLAYDSGHLTPSLVYQEFKKINRPSLTLYVYHAKPAHLKDIRKEIKRLGNAHMIDDGETLNL